jgi:hypothetical protein
MQELEVSLNSMAVFENTLACVDINRGGKVTMRNVMGDLDIRTLTISDAKPLAVAFDSFGLLYVADSRNRITAYDSFYTLIRSFGGSGREVGKFMAIGSMACTPEDTIVVADSGNMRVQVVDRYGNYLYTVGTPQGAYCITTHSGYDCITGRPHDPQRAERREGLVLFGL